MQHMNMELKSILKKSWSYFGAKLIGRVSCTVMLSTIYRPANPQILFRLGCRWPDSGASCAGPSLRRWSISGATRPVCTGITGQIYPVCPDPALWLLRKPDSYLSLRKERQIGHKKIQTDKEANIQTNRQTETNRKRYRQRQVDSQTIRKLYRQKEAGRHSERKTDRQRDR